MIEYKADYTVGERPYICKKFVLQMEKKYILHLVLQMKKNV
jgi:hypothetical protein